MALFRREQTTEIPELKEYYEAQKRENPAKAWLLAIISLLVTIGVVLGLFFGGRWLYRTLFEDDSPSNGSNQTADQGSDSSDAVGDNGAPQQDEADQDNTGDQEETPTTSPTTVPGSDDTDENVSETPSTTTPTTGPLPSTGPADVVAIFVVTVLIGYFARNTYIARKNR
jgi:hypothetical protein